MTTLTKGTNKWKRNRKAKIVMWIEHISFFFQWYRLAYSSHRFKVLLLLENLANFQRSTIGNLYWLSVALFVLSRYSFPLYGLQYWNVILKEFSLCSALKFNWKTIQISHFISFLEIVKTLPLSPQTWKKEKPEMKTNLLNTRFASVASIIKPLILLKMTNPTCVYRASFIDLLVNKCTSRSSLRLWFPSSI